MPPSPNPAPPTISTPTFYLTTSQPLSSIAILLAIIAASLASATILFALRQTGHIALLGKPAATQSAANTKDDKEEKDDPNQIDTIVLGDPSDAPVPARRGDHVSPVHPTILIHLPRTGQATGLIPNTPAGHLLYAWLAAFNHASPTELTAALPTLAANSALTAQLDLRRQTGGFALLSAAEPQPGILVFRLQDQTPSATEALGTLQLVPNSNPAAISTFSLRAVPSPKPLTPTPSAAASAQSNTN